MPSSNDIVQTMMAKDYFSQWLGIKILDIKPGFCKLKLQVKKEMLNGFGIAHGGITYSIADSALAFASNSHGQKSVSVETSISHLKSLYENDWIIAEAIEEHLSNKIASYQIKIIRESDQCLVASFKGTVYRTSKTW